MAIGWQALGVQGPRDTPSSSSCSSSAERVPDGTWAGAASPLLSPSLVPFAGAGVWPQGGRCSWILSRRSARPLSARSPRAHPRCPCLHQRSGRSAVLLTAGFVHMHPHPSMCFFLRRSEEWLPSSVTDVRVCWARVSGSALGEWSLARPVFTSGSASAFTRSCPVPGPFPGLGGPARLPCPSCWS